ncbi:MAG: ATP-binding protein, partial [Alphaproteobacteria bacterium]|nr:ATP-binding protein [Alphaproteobacteria bacterium]
RDHVTLVLRAPLSPPERRWLRHPLPGSAVRVPTVAVLIGRNGSGKTAWLRALTNTIRFATQSYVYPPGPVALFPAFASPDALKEPTRIEIEFDAPALPSSDPEETNRLYRYTLEMHRTESSFFPQTVGYEALHVFPRGRPRRLFERSENRSVYVAKEMAMRSGDDRLVSVPANSSVLSTLARMGVETFSTIVTFLAQIQMNVSFPDTTRLPTETVADYFRANPLVRDQISNKLGRFDLGIEKMDAQLGDDGKWHLVFSHRDLGWDIPYESESAGTRQIVDSFPALNFVLETGRLAVLDALDNDLHAGLVDEILDWFRRRDTNPGNAQLICSLHGLSALEELEKEEIFIVEKDTEGVTGAYSVRDVQGVRRNADLRKLYRGGALGGLPAIG